jgi:putative ABC transport system substrate-binding protein
MASDPNIPPISSAFRQGLAEAGYVPDRNVAFELRRADFPSFLPRLAAELVDRKPAVIVTVGSPYAAVAAKAATSTIPIVFLMVDDPMTYGLVASFSRPGGNLTGVTSLTSELAGKRLNLLVELVPQATKIGYLSVSSDSPVFEDAKNEMFAAGRALGPKIIVGEVRRDFEPAFAAFLEREARAVMVGAFTLFRDARNSAKILELATRHRIPAMYPDRLYPLNGGLMSYASSDREILLRQAGIYTGRVIKGEKPADLPVVGPTKFEFVINLKTAKALGLTIPPTLYALATEVIE